MIDTKTITRLARVHITRFENLLKAAEKGNKNVRVSECAHYLGLWKSVKEKGEWDKLTTAERMEVVCGRDDERN